MPDAWSAVTAWTRRSDYVDQGQAGSLKTQSRTFSWVTSGVSRGKYLNYVFINTNSRMYCCEVYFCLTQSLHVCWFGLFKAWCSSGSDFPCSPAFRFEVSIWCGHTDKSAHCKQFSPIRGFSYITRMAIMGRISELLSLFHEVLVTGLWEAGKWDGTKCFGPTESLNILLVSHHGRCPSTYGLYA